MEAKLTPVKVIRGCITCNSLCEGHLRNVRNVAMRNLLLKKHFELLDCNFDNITPEKLSICNKCIKTLDTVYQMKDNLKKILEERQKFQERKKLITHTHHHHQVKGL